MPRGVCVCVYGGSSPCSQFSISLSNTDSVPGIIRFLRPKDKDTGPLPSRNSQFGGQECRLIQIIW